MNILDLKNKHKNGEIAILGNGLSLHRDIEDLKIDKIPTIGVNASWHHYRSTYQLLLDQPQVMAMAHAQYEPETLIIGDHNYGCSIQRPHYRVHMRFDRKMSFSHDLTQGVFVCRSSVWSAIQVAKYMLGGKGELYFCGLDLGGPRVDGHPKGPEPLPDKSLLAQYELMGYLRHMIDSGEFGDVKAYLSQYSKSLIRSIPRVNYLMREKIIPTLYGDADSALNIVHVRALSPETIKWIRGKSDNLPKGSTKSPE